MHSQHIFILRKAHYIPLALLTGYAVFLALLTLPSVQREVLYLHHIQIPLFPVFSNPERYGLAPFKTRNLRLKTSDGESIGAWHILPRSIYQAQKPFPPLSSLRNETFDQALLERPTIIYFHGNAGSRVTPHRVRSYSSFSNYLDCNVIAIDYRGFGDSSGIPTEDGLLTDARAAWDYVSSRIEAEKGHAGDNVILAGQSLGTGVVAGLAGQLATEGVRPRALVLVAPFTSISELLTSYKLFRFIPVLGPLRYLPSTQRYLQSFLYHPFDSTSALMNTTSPTLLLHAINDMTIPHSHSERLFASLRSALPKGKTGEVSEITYDSWGVVRTLHRDDARAGEVVWWEGRKGGHNNLGWAEGTLDLIRRIAKL